MYKFFSLLTIHFIEGKKRNEKTNAKCLVLMAIVEKCKNFKFAMWSQLKLIGCNFLETTKLRKIKTFARTLTLIYTFQRTQFKCIMNAVMMMMKWRLK